MLGSGREEEVGAALLTPQETEEMSRQDEDVLGAVAEWGNDQRNDVEPVEEVFAESALLDRVFERSIGRAHDPDIGPAFLRLAEPFVGLVVKESEQPGLSIRGEVADLVEKECPTFGLFHLADSVCHGACLLYTSPSPRDTR